jgi:uncharacterized protein (TIRG00374 family)
MSPRFKKVALLFLKIAILVGLLEYVRRQSQLGDEIAVSEPNSSAASDERLKVVRVRETPEGAPLAYLARTPRGVVVEIPAADVEGSPARSIAGPARFSLLPGLRTLFRRLDLRYLALAFAAFGPALFLLAVRWRFLLRASGVVIPFWILVRLHYMSFFFNMFLPGGAGGDIIKAVYVTQHSTQKTEAATVVLVDRVVGLVGLLVMAGGVVLLNYQTLHGIALQVGAISLALALLFAIFFSTWLRRLIRYEAVLEKLPRSEVLKKVDGALVALWRKKPRLAAALALTMSLQFMEVIGVWLAGQALGLSKASFVHYVAFVPIGYLVNAVPISFGGIGLMEGAYLKLFRDAGVATATQGFALAILGRAIVVGWSLLGALSALFPPEATRSC